MLALLLALQDVPPILPLATSVDGFPVGAIEPSMATSGCTAFIWVRTASRVLVAQATAEPGTIRLAIDGKPASYAISAQNGIGASGFSRTTEYRAGKVVVTLDLAITTKLGGEVQVGESTLRIERPDTPPVVVPVAGMIRCA